MARSREDRPLGRRNFRLQSWGMNRVILSVASIFSGTVSEVTHGGLKLRFDELCR
jgi:hypothetical protein